MTDPIVTIYDRIVALLQAEPTLYDATGNAKDLIRPKNLIIYSGTQPHPEKLNRTEGDFPELDVDEAGYTDTGFTKWPTFGNSIQGGCTGRQEITQVYQLTLTGRDYRLGSVSNLRFAISLALSKGGPRLGLPTTLVKQWGPMAAGQPAKVLVKNRDNSEGGTYRRQFKIMVPVSILINTSDLQN